MKLSDKWSCDRCHAVSETRPKNDASIIRNREGVENVVFGDLCDTCADEMARKND